MVRWDSPLISIPWDEDPPFEEIWNVVIKGEKKGPTAAVMQVGPSPSPNPISLQIRVSKLTPFPVESKTCTKRTTYPHKHNFNNNDIPLITSPSNAYGRYIPHPLPACSRIRLTKTTPSYAEGDITRTSKAQKTI